MSHCPLTQTALIVLFTLSLCGFGCGEDPILTAAEAMVEPTPTLVQEGQPTPGTPDEPLPGQPQVTGEAEEPTAAVPEEPTAAVPEEPTPGIPGEQSPRPQVLLTAPSHHQVQRV